MAKEDEILKIAEEEFHRNGYVATSMVNVARRAGVTHAMVNYYFRSKEQLFLRILDKHSQAFIARLKSIMKEGADFVQTSVDTANSLFDTLNEDRMFPFLIQDVARTEPELLEKYREPMENFLVETSGRHSPMLREQIETGIVRETTMKEILENIMLLVTSSFLVLPTLENLAGLSPAEIDVFLARRKSETEALIRSRYTVFARERL